MPKPTRRLINRTSENNIEVLDSDIESFVSSLKNFLSSHFKDLLNELKGKKESSTIARLGGIFQGLKDAGLDDELKSINKLYTKELVKVKKGFQDTEPTASAITTAVDRTTIEAFVRLREGDVVAQVESVASEVSTAILEQVVIGTTPKPAEIVERIGGTLANIKTELRTGIMKFHRSAARVQADELGLRLGYYSGPILDNTREFCRGLIEDRDPPIYTIDEIEAMDNDQGLDVVTSGGGYNCVHHWRWISEKTAKDLGWEPE